MIRINLQAAERPTGKKKAAAAAPGAPGALQAYLFLALFGGGALVVCGALWWLQSNRIAELDSQIEQARKRQAELQAIKAKVDEYEAQKRTLDAKIALIERLQSEQSAPVHLLDEVSRALPDFVWLTAMDQVGQQIRFKGESNGLTAVADFMTRLQQAGAPSCAEPSATGPQADRSKCYFTTVELQSSQENNNVVSFEVSANFQNAYTKIKAAPAAAAGGGAPAAAAGAPVQPKNP